MKTIKRKIRNFLRIVLFFVLIFAFGGYVSCLTASDPGVETIQDVYLINAVVSISVLSWDFLFYRTKGSIYFYSLSFVLLLIFNPLYPVYLGSIASFLITAMFIYMLFLYGEILRLDEPDSR